MAKDKSYSDEKIQYLNMIQSIISRLSAITPVVKGFAIAFIVAIPVIASAVGYSCRGLFYIALGFIFGGFLCIDMYYLMLEKRYRVLYEKVRNGEHEIDFDLKLPKLSKNDRLKDYAKVSFESGVSSPSIWIFYGVLLISMLLILIAIGV